MPTSPRLRELDRQLTAVVRPALEPRGFMAGSHRSFRHIQPGAHGSLVHIVHFQVGIKWLVGKFTANLVVYHSAFCPHPGAVAPEAASFGDGFLALWTRVAKLEPPRPSLIEKLLRRTPEAEDRWWPQSDNPAQMAGALREVLALVLKHAPAWFETHGTEDACQQEFERVRARLRARSESVPSE
jgi:hypothetical protein